MGSNLSIVDALAHIESKIAHHKEQLELHTAQEALYAGQAAFHAEQKSLHEAEHRKAVQRYESFKAASTDIGELLVDVKPRAPSPAPLPQDIATGGWRWLSKLMTRVIEIKGPDEVFGPSTIIKEIQERWGAKLKQRIDPRSASTTLRRWATEGRLELVRDGRSFHESLYRKRQAAKPDE
jgi:hypothetical protein